MSVCYTLYVRAAMPMWERAHAFFCLCVCMCVCGGGQANVALSDLPRGLHGPNEMVGNSNFTTLSPPSPLVV